MSSIREARLGDAAGDYAAARGELREACEAGCGVACLEYARNSWDPSEADDYNQRACDAGEADGCARLTSADASARAQLCERGDPLACFGAQPQQLHERGAAACERNDGRACAAQGWARCGFLGECDGEAVEVASKAARLVPEAPVLEVLAALQCHAGQVEDANGTLSQSCEAGVNDACERSCEQLRPDMALLVRAAERAIYDEILTLTALQGNTDPGWIPTVSVMSVAELQKLQKVLQVFTPAMTDDGAAAKVSDEIRAAYPEIVAAILRAPQLDAKKIKYWIKRLPEMDDEQRLNLLDSLRNQWWMLPEEGSRTPADVIDDARWTNGGLGPLPPAE